MENVISGFWSALELGAQLLFWKSFFQSKVLNREYWLAVASVWVLNQFYVNCGLTSEWITGLTLALHTAVSCLINKGKWYQHLLMSFVFVGLSGVIDTIFFVWCQFHAWN